MAAAGLSTAAVLSAERRAAFALRAGRTRLRSSVGTGAEPRSAVLVPLCQVEGRPGLLYTRRAARLSRHAREVAFPGGHRDAEDADLLATALRECREEIGLALPPESVWTPPLPTLPSRFDNLVVPYLADAGPLCPDQLQPHQGEVEEIFVLSLEHLCNPDNFRYTQFRSKSVKNGGYSMPVFVNGPHRIWGLTAIITHFTLSLLVPEFYKQKPQFLKPLVPEDATTS